MVISHDEYINFIKSRIEHISEALKGASIIPSESVEPNSVIVSLDILERLAGYEMTDGERKNILPGPTLCGTFIGFEMYCDKDLPCLSVMVHPHYAEVIRTAKNQFKPQNQ